jgi:pimeloyl-ACP methyl ester carboxylesterase
LSDYLVIGRFATPALRQMQLDAQRSLSPGTLVARLKAIAQVDVTDQLRSVALPILYMRATEDRLVPRSASEYFLRFARAGRVVDLEGPHFLLQAKPSAAAAELRRFIGEVE